jgi:hypothetical protein
MNTANGQPETSTMDSNSNNSLNMTTIATSQNGKPQRTSVNEEQGKKLRWSDGEDKSLCELLKK